MLRGRGNHFANRRQKCLLWHGPLPHPEDDLRRQENDALAARRHKHTHVLVQEEELDYTTDRPVVIEISRNACVNTERPPNDPHKTVSLSVSFLAVSRRPLCGCCCCCHFCLSPTSHTFMSRHRQYVCRHEVAVGDGGGGAQKQRESRRRPD